MITMVSPPHLWEELIWSLPESTLTFHFVSGGLSTKWLAQVSPSAYISHSANQAPNDKLHFTMQNALFWTFLSIH